MPLGINTQCLRIAFFRLDTPMKKIALMIALAISSLSAAQAQDATASRVSYVIGGGLTVGGDKIATVEYTDGSELSVRAGSIFTIYGGVDFRVTDAFSIQSTIGIHGDNASARNGDVRFERMPLELLAYYHVNPQWRIGGGARYVSNAKVKSEGAAYMGNFRFDNALGGVVEAEYMAGAKLGVKIRYVKETYKHPAIEDVDGSHVGILANIYF